jgi:glycosyltransferase involved in cell wall biosynthesis
LSQTFHDYEVIVVDDGSTDSTPKALRGFDGKIRVLSQRNRGVASARNLGVQESRGLLLAFLDSDDEWRPEKLAAQADLYHEDSPLYISHTDEVWLRNGTELPQKRIHRKQGGRFFERALERCLISPSAAMISKRLLDDVGWFDETLPAAEDYDLWLRVTAFHAVDFIPRPLVIKHGGHGDQLSATTPAIDRFRIRAIQKMLSDLRLSPEHRGAAIAELARKCGVVAVGCKKRGKLEEEGYYRALADYYKRDRPAESAGH